MKFAEFIFLEPGCSGLVVIYWLCLRMSNKVLFSQFLKYYVKRLSEGSIGTGRPLDSRSLPNYDCYSIGVLGIHWRIVVGWTLLLEIWS